MSDQTVSINFVANSGQYLNPISQMSKATGQFSSAGKIARDVLVALGVAAVGTALAMRAPTGAANRFRLAIESAFSRAGAAAAAGANLIRNKIEDIGINLGKNFITDFARRATVSIGQLAFLDKAMIATGLALAGGLTIAVKAAASFDQAMRNVNSVLGYTPAQFEKLSNVVLQVSKNFPQAANDVAAAVYKIGSGGFTKFGDVTQILKASAVGATAGMSDMATSANLLVNVLNAYGLSASDAAHVNDILFQGVRLGQFSFNELAGQIGSFLPLAHNLGATLGETIGVYSLLSKVSGNAAESATYLEGVMRALIDPSQDATKVLHLMGFESGVSAVQTLGLAGTVRGMSAAVDGNIVSVGKLFPNIRALNGVLEITGQSASTVTNELAQFTDASKVNGAAQRALNEQMKSVTNQIHKFLDGARAFAIEIGRGMLPVVALLVGGLQALLDILNSLPDWMLKGVGVAAGLASAFLILGGAVLAVRSTLSLFRAVSGVLNLGGLASGVRSAATSFKSGAASIEGNTVALEGNTVAAEAAAASEFTLAEEAAAADATIAAQTATVGSSSISMGLLGRGVAGVTPMLANLGSVIGIAAIAFAGFQAAAQLNDAWSHTDEKVRTLSADLVKLTHGSASAADVLGNANFGSDKGIMGLLEKVSHLSGGDVMTFSTLEQQLKSVDKAMAALVHSGTGGADAAGQALTKLANSVDVQKLLGVKDSAGALKLLKDDYLPGYAKALRQASDEAVINSINTKDQADQFKGLAESVVVAGDSEKYLTAATDAMTASQKEFNSALQNFPAQSSNDALQAVLQTHQDIFNAAKQSNKASATAQGPTPTDIAVGQSQIQRAIMGVTTARQTLAQAQQKNFDLDVKQAQENLDASYRDTTRDVYALQDAVKALNDLLHPSARTVDEANIALQRSLIDQQNNIQAVADAQDKLNLARDHAMPNEITQAQRDLTSAQYNLRESGYAVVDAQKAYNDLTQRTPDTQKKIALATLDVADAQRTLSDSTDTTVTAQKALMDLREQIGNQPQIIAAAELDLKDAILGVAQAQQALVKQETSPEQKTATDSFDKQIDLQNTTLGELEQKLEDQIKAQQNYWTNIISLGQKYGPGVVEQLLAMGQDGTALVQKMADDTSGSSRKMADDLITNAAYGSKTFRQIIDTNIGAAPGQVRTYTQNAMQSLADELHIGVDAAKKILDDYGLKLDSVAASYIVETSPGNFVTVDPSKTRILGHGIPSAGGNLFEDHSPQISRGGPTRIWSEPETGGEAYIPLAASKRSRSVGILRQVAGMFGDDVYRYADGGVLPPPLTDSDFGAKGNKKILMLPAEHTSQVMYAAVKFMLENGGGRIVNEALKWLGGPYQWGGGHGGPVPIGTPVDCSGMVDQIAMALGIPGVSGNTLTQQYQGAPGSANAPGTLLFFGNKSAPHHVGISMGPNKMISALNPAMGIRITSLLDDYNGTARDISRGGSGAAVALPGIGTGADAGIINDVNDFATALLKSLSDPITGQDIATLAHWAVMEGGNWRNNAAFNPLNTTQGMPGSHSINSVGVQAYTSWEQGLAATVKTLTNGFYPHILADLASGHGLTRGDDGDLTTWGTGAIFDKGGWLPPKSQTLMANNTRYWEPVGQASAGGTHYHVPVSVDARIASNIDLDKASAIISDQVTKGVTTALKTVEAKVRQRNGR